MGGIKQEVLDHIVHYRGSLKNKPYLIDLFSSSKKVVIDDYSLEEEDDGWILLTVLDKKFFGMVTGRLFTLSNDPNQFYYTIAEPVNSIDKYRIRLSSIKVSDKFEKLADFFDEFTLKNDMIENHKGSPIETTVGRYYLNQFLLVDVFGDLFPYNNDLFKFRDYESQICEMVILDKISVNQVYNIVDRLTFMESLVEMFMPTITKELLTIDPAVKKLINDLLREHRNDLSNPQVMIMIEDAIIKADKDSLKGNSAMDYASGKTFNVHRKRMFHGFGAVDSFGGQDGAVTFLMTNLDDGWKKEEMPTLFNDIRKGIYSRGIETAEGGSITKQLSRTLQSSAITEKDCKSTTGKELILTNDLIERYLYRYVIDPKDKKKTILLTRDNIKGYIGKSIEIRTPKHCKTANGYCYTCFGYKYLALAITLLGGEAVKIGSTIMLLSMKKMHGTKAEVTEIDMNMFIS